MTRPCSNWRQRSSSEWRPLTTLGPVIVAAAGWFDSCGRALFRHHLVLQETNEERRTVANNLMSVFTTAANHVSTSEVNLSLLHNFLSAHSFEIFVMWCPNNRSVWRIYTVECNVSAPKRWKRTRRRCRSWGILWGTLFLRRTDCKFVK